MKKFERFGTEVNESTVSDYNPPKINRLCATNSHLLVDQDVAAVSRLGII